jgi:hypothetical protein
MDFEQMGAELDVIKAEYREKMKVFWGEAVKSIFEKAPSVETIFWRQYVPMFNDGEACEFGLGEIEFTNAPHDVIDGPYWTEEMEDDEYELFSPYGDSEESKSLSAFLKLMYQIEDHLEMEYGSCAFVKLHKDGVEFEEWDAPY